MDFIKKAMTFITNNWFAVAIIVGLLLFSGSLNSCANKKIDKLNTAIAQLKKDNTGLDQQLKAREKDYKVLGERLVAIMKTLEDLQKEKLKLEADKKKLDTKYANLYAKFGTLSAAQQDALLLEVLKKNGITAEIRENSLVITLEDRGVLYKMMISVDELREKLANSEAATVNCQVTVTAKDGQIKICTDVIALKDLDIDNLRTKITNLEKIISTQKNKIFWTKVSSFAKKAIPALIIGLVTGYLVAK